MIPALTAAAMIISKGVELKNRRDRIGAWNNTQSTIRNVNKMYDPTDAIDQNMGAYGAVTEKPDPYGLNQWNKGVYR